MLTILPKLNLTPSYCSLVGLGQYTQVQGISAMSNAFEELNTERPTLVFFLAPTKPLQSYRQARTSDIVLVKCIEMTALPWWLREEG